MWTRDKLLSHCTTERAFNHLMRLTQKHSTSPLLICTSTGCWLWAYDSHRKKTMINRWKNHIWSFTTPNYQVQKLCKFVYIVFASCKDIFPLLGVIHPMREGMWCAKSSHGYESNMIMFAEPLRISPAFDSIILPGFSSHFGNSGCGLLVVSNKAQTTVHSFFCFWWLLRCWGWEVALSFLLPKTVKYHAEYNKNLTVRAIYLFHFFRLYIVTKNEWTGRQNLLC